MCTALFSILSFLLYLYFIAFWFNVSLLINQTRKWWKRFRSLSNWWRETCGMRFVRYLKVETYLFFAFRGESHTQYFFIISLANVNSFSSSPRFLPSFIEIVWCVLSFRHRLLRDRVLFAFFSSPSLIVLKIWLDFVSSRVSSIVNESHRLPCFSVLWNAE